MVFLPYKIMRIIKRPHFQTLFLDVWTPTLRVRTLNVKSLCDIKKCIQNIKDQMMK